MCAVFAVGEVVTYILPVLFLALLGDMFEDCAPPLAPLLFRIVK